MYSPASISLTQTFWTRSMELDCWIVRLEWYTTEQYSRQLLMKSLYIKIKSSLLTPTYFNFDSIEVLIYAFLHTSLVLRSQDRSSDIHKPRRQSWVSGRVWMYGLTYENSLTLSWPHSRGSTEKGTVLYLSHVRLVLTMPPITRLGVVNLFPKTKQKQTLNLKIFLGIKMNVLHLGIWKIW